MDDLTAEQRHKNMSNIHSSNTKPEEIVRKYLFQKGFRYRKNDKRYPGKPDIVLPKYRVVIFVHGCFWHQHKDCRYAVLPKSNPDYWLPKLTRNMERDDKSINALQELGWRVIIVWECALKPKQRSSCLEQLPRIIQEQQLPFIEIQAQT